MLEGLEAVFPAHFLLQSLDPILSELDEPAAAHAEHMVVVSGNVLVLGPFLAPEYLPQHAARFQMRQSAVDRRTRHLHALRTQALVEFVRVEMIVARDNLLQNPLALPRADEVLLAQMSLEFS